MVAQLDIRKGKSFDNMIIEAIQCNYIFLAWQAIDGEIEQCAMHVKLFRKEYNEIELEISEGQYEKLSKVISGNRIMNIYVPELSVSFSSELKSITGQSKVKISVPLEYSFYERRKHERVTPSKVCYTSFELGKKLIRRSIFDFSFGGISIILPKSDKIIIEKGSLLSEFVIEIGAKKIKTKAECVKVFLIDRFKFENFPYGGHRIAFRFIDMSKDDKMYLAKFITMEILTNKSKKKAN